MLSNGKNFTPLEVGRQSFASGRGEYGYFSPILIQTKVSGPANPT
jgi:hypothetical protein